MILSMRKNDSVHQIYRKSIYIKNALFKINITKNSIEIRTIAPKCPNINMGYPWIGLQKRDVGIVIILILYQNRAHFSAKNAQN